MKSYLFIIFEGKPSNVKGEYSVRASSSEDAKNELLKYSFTGDYRLAMVS